MIEAITARKSPSPTTRRRVFLPFGWQTQPYTFESHTSSSWSLGGDFSMGLSRGVWGNVTRHSPQIAAFLRTDTHSSHSTRTDATGTQTNQSQTVTTTTGGSGGDSLDQTWASDYSWIHTPPPPGGGSGSGGRSGRLGELTPAARPGAVRRRVLRGWCCWGAIPWWSWFAAEIA